MTQLLLTFSNPFHETANTRLVPIEFTTEKTFSGTKAHYNEQGFTGKAGQITIERNNDGETTRILAGINQNATYEDGAKIYHAIASSFSEEFLKDTSFSFEIEKNNAFENIERLYIGWGWANYRFDMYKEKTHSIRPALLSPHTKKTHILSMIESVCFTRDLVNIPANDMGPDELETATQFLCDHHDIALTVTKDAALLEQNFPMIHTVGRASTRRPRLLDFTWGDEKKPKVTLVGKGVCFDTGGLDIKPSQFMLLMKKDMGGAAQVLGLAHLIMSMNLPIRLRVLIPAVENAIDGNAYRPSDIIKSRKGMTVEIGNTDAEGRLVLADALTYASEEKPDLIVDFATLTGAARVALGHDLPALFSNNETTARDIQDLSHDTDDSVWNLPLWQPYRKELDSPNADISSTGGKAGSTTAALFLQEFIDNDIEWIHLDCFAWQQDGKPTCPKGGADTGLRAIYAFLEKRYRL